MADQGPKYSRTSRKQGSKASKVNRVLNISIGVVIFLIAVVAIIFLTGDDEKEVAIDKPEQSTQSDTAPMEPIVLDDENDEDKPETEDAEPEEADEPDEPEVQAPEENNEVVNEVVEEPEAPVVEAPKVDEPKKQQTQKVEPKKEQPKQDKPKKETSSDSGKKVVVNPDWKPVGTKQSGEHVSKYDGQSDDWHEKKKAISYATGMSEDQLYFDRIQNGGSPQKSEGIVRSKDNSKKFKVYLQWVDGQGWKPVKMEVLK
ncbi:MULTISPECIES: DUF1510 family protein [unclassified Sporosarcina]|uniref:DUF1510 family protein n=1 Tax=unclassified Sporosarcina TaxID=2647733 RepID=UPI00130445AA|nr:MULTISPECIES: DUF1510 family protein [unclassified Sporosarcina]